MPGEVFAARAGLGPPEVVDEVVVDFGRGLVLVRAQDPAYVLGQAALTGEGRGEELGIQGGQSKPSSA